MVCNIFTKSETAISVQAWQYLDLIEEIGHHFGASIKILLIGLRPPVDKVSIFIKLATLIIESMGHLMTNNYANSAIVERIISLHIEERILENSSREADFV